MAGDTYYTRTRVTVFAVALIIGISLSLTPIRGAERFPEPGETAERTIVAQEPLAFPSGELTRAAREAAREAVPPQHRFDEGAAAAQVAALNGYLSAVAAAREGGVAPTGGIADRAVPESAEIELLALDEIGFVTVQRHAASTLQSLMAEPLRASELDDLRRGIPAALPAELTHSQAALAAALVGAYLAPTSLYDAAADAAARDRAAAAVRPVTRTIAAAETVIAEGEETDALAAEALARMEPAGARALIEPMVAAVILAVIAAAALGLFLMLTKPAAAASDRRMLVFGVLIILAIAAARGWLEAPLLDGPIEDWELMSPIIAAPLLIAALLSPALGLAAAVLISICGGVAVLTVPDYGAAGLPDGVHALRPAIILLLTSITVVIASTRVRLLSHFAVAAGAAGLILFVSGLIFWPFEPERDLVQIAWLLVAGAIMAAGVSIAAVLLFTPLAAIAGVTTRLKLLETAQLANPLLQRLQREAPGTYRASMITAALSERAAARIGADSLLCRAGAYYHDVGKLENPQVHPENRPAGAPNPHDGMQPSESARAITDHVRAGSRLAADAHLPPPVRAFVREHHGTRRVNYFYRQALEREPHAPAAQFSYPGPAPATRESAIVMLADSCESVVRSSPDHDPETIELLVDGVIEERIAEGQLDSCDLTMREIRIAGREFKRALSRIYATGGEPEAAAPPVGAGPPVVAPRAEPPDPAATGPDPAAQGGS